MQVVRRLTRLSCAIRGRSSASEAAPRESADRSAVQPTVQPSQGCRRKTSSNHCARGDVDRSTHLRPQQQQPANLLLEQSDPRNAMGTLFLSTYRIGCLFVVGVRVRSIVLIEARRFQCTIATAMPQRKQP